MKSFEELVKEFDQHQEERKKLAKVATMKRSTPEPKPFVSRPKKRPGLKPGFRSAFNNEAFPDFVRLGKIANYLQKGQLIHEVFAFNEYNTFRMIGDRNSERAPAPLAEAKGIENCGYSGGVEGEFPAIFPNAWLFSKRTGRPYWYKKYSEQQADDWSTCKQVCEFLRITPHEYTRLFVPQLVRTAKPWPHNLGRGGSGVPGMTDIIMHSGSTVSEAADNINNYIIWRKIHNAPVPQKVGTSSPE